MSMDAVEHRREDEPSPTEPGRDRFWEREEELRRLLHEEQSLRNVATLLATAGPAEDILTAICQEASAQIEGQEVSLLRFETPEVVVSVATYGGPIPPGVRAVHTTGSLMDLVATTQMPVRVDDFTGHSDENLIRPFGIRAAVAVPVFVDNEVWGMFSASSQTGPLPEFTEKRLSGFAQLTWTAIANTQVREDLRRLAQEQAAIRQVAELVARESPLPLVFHAVVDAVRELHSAHAVLTAVDGDKEGVVARAGETPPGDNRQLRVPIDVDGLPWGNLHITWPASLGPISPERPKAFTDLIAAAVANANHRDGLTRSRARVIAAADEARRQLQRDVHDGAQQRLVHTIITLKLARDRAASGLDVGDLLSEALTNAEDANSQLRDIVRGILPAALTRSGLEAGIQSLVADAPLPVELHLTLPRLPAAVETTGYFAVAEAVTNAIKHAHANRIIITGEVSGNPSTLILVIDDDGVGGADTDNGTGLIGLADRIEAAGGTLDVVSEHGQGTQLTAAIPAQQESRA